MLQRKRSIADMTAQEIFDKVWQFFIVEKHPRAQKPGESCTLRYENTKCALGCLIPDDLYHPEMEWNNTVGSFFDKHRDVVEKIGLQDHEGLLRDLQHWHDSYLGEDGSMRELYDIANAFGLKIPAKAVLG
jgi:hypothetical protein